MMHLINRFSIKAKTYMLVGLSVLVALVLSLVSSSGMNIIETEVNELILINNIERHTYRTVIEEKNYLLNANGSVVNHSVAQEAFENAEIALQNIYRTLDKLEYIRMDIGKELRDEVESTRKAITEYDDLYKRGVYLLGELEKERHRLQQEGENITRQIQEYVEAKRVDVKAKLSQKTIEKINAGSNIWQYTYMTRADEKRYLLSPDLKELALFRKDYDFMMSELERLKGLSNQAFEHEKIAIFAQSAKNYEEAMMRWVEYDKEHRESILPKTKELGEAVLEQTHNVAQKAVADIAQKRKLVITVSVLVTLFVIIVGVLFGGLISRSISSVLMNFQEGLLEFFGYLDRRKNSAHKIEIKSKDEIAMMAEVVNENITKIEEVMEKKLAQMKEKDEHIRRQSRLAQMGEMISMIAHQWRQPLGAISATTNDMEIKLFKRRLFDVSTSKGQNEMQAYVLESLHTINKFIEHLSATIDDFTDFFKSKKEKSSFHLYTLMNKTLNLSGHLFRSRGIEIVKAYEDGLEELTNYDSEITQVFLNIIHNAVDALVEKKIENPSIYITIGRNRLSRQIVMIEDNAGGIPEDMLDKVFDPYFSTKDKNGTGLGLYMSQMIIEEHCNGHIRVTNTNRGACFTVEFLNEGEENGFR